MLGNFGISKIIAKETNYHPDGTGRDNYIWLQNGGNYKCQKERSSGYERGIYQTNREFKPVNSHRNARQIHYNNNGSGRDTYIITDEGGLANVIKGQKPFNFIRNLRTNTYHQPQVRPSDFFATSQYSPFKNTNQILIKKFGEEQRSLDKRLAQHRSNLITYRDIGNIHLPSLKK